MSAKLRMISFVASVALMACFVRPASIPTALAQQAARKAVYRDFIMFINRSGIGRSRLFITAAHVPALNQLAMTAGEYRPGAGMRPLGVFEIELWGAKEPEQQMKFLEAYKMTKPEGDVAKLDLPAKYDKYKLLQVHIRP